MQIVTAAELHQKLNRATVIQVVRQALIDHANGLVQSPMPGQLLFHKAHGDCHIKFGHRQGDRHYVIKVASGFYKNPERSLPVNNGLVLVFDAETGQPVYLFQDEGWLTAWRTAAAAALGVQCLAPTKNPHVGIVGTGLQATLALEWLPIVLPEARLLVYGRNAEKASVLAASHNVEFVPTIADLLQSSNCILTTTPAMAPLFDADLVRAGTHVVGLGADGDGKQELPPALFKRASHVVVDDKRQCIALSDTGKAIEKGFASEEHLISFGALLENPSLISRAKKDITILDLTGLAVQDIAIAGLFAEHFGEQPVMM